MICTLCESFFARGEPKTFLGGDPVHLHCNVDSPVDAPCDDPACQWWCVDHAGVCVT
jgi:hypothetical protein